MQSARACPSRLQACARVPLEPPRRQQARRLMVDALRWARLAARSGVGARSEALVRRAPSRLEAEGWRLQHSLPSGEHGDIDTIAIAPTGVGVVIETKTRARSTHATWPTPGRRRRGFTGIGSVGVGEERSRCCAWCTPAGSSTSRTRFLSCRLTAGAGAQSQRRNLTPASVTGHVDLRAAASGPGPVDSGSRVPGLPDIRCGGAVRPAFARSPDQANSDVAVP